MKVAQARNRAINSLRPRSILSRAYGDKDTDGPVAFWDARAHDGGEILKDLSGRGHHLQMGSTHVSKVIEGEGLLLPGIAGRYAIAPHRDEYAITGDIDIIGHIALSLWYGSSDERSIVSRWEGSNTSYLFRVTTDNRLNLFIYDSVGQVSSYSDMLPEPETEFLWVRVTWRQSDGRVQFFTKQNEKDSWIQLGSDGSAVASGGIRAGTSALTIGIQNTSGGDLFKGTIKRAIVHDGINGPKVFDADFTKQPDGTTSFTEDALGATVTINGTTSPDTNDPLFLDHDGDDYLYLPGQTSDLAFTNPSAFPTGDIDVKAKLNTVWVSGVNQRYVDWYLSSAGILFDVDSAGRLVASLGDGTSLLAVDSVDVIPFTDNTDGWVRFTWRKSDGRVQFFTSEDGEAWLQLGTDKTINLASIANPNDICIVGTDDPSVLFIGKVYSAQVYDGIDGTLVADFDASRSREPHRSFVDSVDNVWTINRSTSGRKAALVDRPMFLFGTDDYMETPDHPDLDFGADQDFTVVAAYRLHNIDDPSSAAIVAKKFDGGSTTPGWLLFSWSTSNGSRFYVNDGTNGTALNGVNRGDTLGKTFISAATRDTGADSITVFNNGDAGQPATDGTVTTLHNALPVRIGRYSGSGSTAYADMEFIGAAIFRRALTDLEIEEISREFGWHQPSTILEEAIVAAVAGVHDPVEDRLLDVTGHGHDFVLGGTVAASTNDPLLLPYDGEKYVYLPGTTDNYPATPIPAEWSAVTDEFRIEGKFNCDDWTPSSQTVLIGNWPGVALTIRNSGVLGLSIHDGSVEEAYNAPSAHNIPDGTDKWVAVDWIGNDGNGNSEAKFYLSDDGVNWTLFETVTKSTTYSVNHSGGTVRVGALTSSLQLLTGICYKVKVYSDRDSNDLVMEFNPDRDAEEPYNSMVSSTTGETWTFNRAASGRKLAVVDQNLLLFGTDDYAEALDHDELDFGADDDFTVCLLYRTYAANNDQIPIAKKQSAGNFGAGYVFRQNSGPQPLVTAYIADGSLRPGISAAITLGVLDYRAILRDVSLDILKATSGEFPNGASTSDTTTASLATSEPLRIGKEGAGNYLDAEIMAVALVRRALTEAELQQLADELIAFNTDPTTRLVSRPEPLRALPERVIP